ncbi:MAG: 6-phosphogluconolactonase [Propionibacteriaceae bacterium]
MPEIIVHPAGDAFAEAIARRLASRVGQLQAGGTRSPQVSLTGGRIALRTYQHLAGLSDREDIDWTSVDWWWSDERFVPAGDNDRNDASTIAAIQAALPVPPERLHPMPAADAGRDLDEAAAAYASELGGRAFDITLLGVGPDGHVASIFPDHPSLDGTGEVIAVRNSPKPPPDRISLTLETLNRSREVWFTVSGAEKAGAVKSALMGGPVPAARVTGVERTLWLVDTDAAAELPASLTAP